MSFFFNLLPTDLQVHVLHGWLNKKDGGHHLVRVLSAMDVACSKSHQDSFRQFVSQFPAFGELDPLSKKSNPTRFVTNYLLWLCSREVAIKFIALTRPVYDVEQLIKSDMRLPSVKAIMWSDDDYLSSELVEAVMRVCPNVTHLELGRKIDFSRSIVQHVPKLKSITIGGSRFTPPHKNMKSVMVFGLQLRDLRMPYCEFDQDMFDIMSIMALGLQALEIRLCKAESERFLQFQHKCKKLRELIVHCSEDDLDADTISQIAASPHLNRLTVRVYAKSKKTCSIFASVLEQRPDLKHLQIGEWILTPDEGILHVSLDKEGYDPTALAVSLSACPVVKELKVAGTVCDKAVAQAIVRNVKGSLQSLTVTVNDSVALEMLLRKFGMTLKRLDVRGEGITMDTVRFIAMQCPLLESIVLKNGKGSDCESYDEAISSIFAACTRIQKVNINSLCRITVETLQTILTRRVRLQQLHINHCCVDESEKEWFRRQAKEQQLLPVPDLGLLEALC